MRKQLFILACAALLGGQASAATTVLSPLSECEWGLVTPTACPSLDTRQDKRATLVFDFSGIDPSAILSITLELVPVQASNQASFLGDIEAIGLSTPTPADPFVNTLIGPQAGPCNPPSASCPATPVENPDSGDGRYSFSRRFDEGFPRLPADVSDAINVLGAATAYLQLGLIPVDEFSGIQFGHSGFADPRLAPASLVVELADCDDGIDNDGDGFTDFDADPSLSDPGCVDSKDLSETDPLLPCDDGADNDGDQMTDMADLGCKSPAFSREDPACQDGQDNDLDGRIDFDGGVSIWGGQVGEPDTNCSSFSDYRERRNQNCGLGWELALLLPGLMWLHRRRRRLH